MKLSRAPLKGSEELRKEKRIEGGGEEKTSRGGVQLESSSINECIN